MYQFFDTDIAAELGISAAVVYEYIRAVAPRGRVRLTADEAHADIPYLSRATINRALNKLKDAGLVVCAREGDILDSALSWGLADEIEEQESRFGLTADPAELMRGLPR